MAYFLLVNFKASSQNLMLGFPFLFASYYQSISLQLRKEKLNRLFHFFAPRNKISVGISLTDMSLDPFSCYFSDS